MDPWSLDGYQHEIRQRGFSGCDELTSLLECIEGFGFRSDTNELDRSEDVFVLTMTVF
ncbi:hypothetical protein LY76DRAFT_537118 [Colletotrichum caudatum]|nr:hypothetical protein LY76DRAFT_537118 [Colletotrichum caudatum]